MPIERGKPVIADDVIHATRFQEAGLATISGQRVINPASNGCGYEAGSPFAQTVHGPEVIGAILYIPNPVHLGRFWFTRLAQNGSPAPDGGQKLAIQFCKMNPDDFTIEQQYGAITETYTASQTFRTWLLDTPIDAGLLGVLFTGNGDMDFAWGVPVQVKRALRLIRSVTASGVGSSPYSPYGELTTPQTFPVPQNPLQLSYIDDGSVCPMFALEVTG